MTKTCPKCHTDNQADARFCFECGLAFSDQQTAPRLCPAGKHPMDPAWTSCPYCSGSQPAVNPAAGQSAGSPGSTPSEGRKRPPTTPEQQASTPSPGRDHSDPKPDRDQAPSGGRKKTDFGEAPQPSASTPRSSQPGTRRVVAVLVTYSWRPQGQIFPVYEGRNYLGRDPDCEICLDSDSQLSGHQSAIFYRGETFEITDEKSMNGTFVNGKSVPLTGLPLDNNAVIVTGSTTWRFIIIPPVDDVNQT